MTQPIMDQQQQQLQQQQQQQQQPMPSQPMQPMQPNAPMQPMQPPAFPPPPVPPSSARPAEEMATHITVSDPVQHQDGMSKFTSYRVDVRPPEDPNTNADNSTGNPAADLSQSIFVNATYS